MAREIPWIKLVVLGLLGGLIAVVTLVVRGGTAIPDELQPIEWNRQPCAHCQMLVGEPRHAAQLITATGEVLVFDDPGCALRYLEQRRPAVHRLWFHHGTADRWIPSDRVGFTAGGTTPMGSGLVAVERDAPNALDLAAASRVAFAKETP